MRHQMRSSRLGVKVQHRAAMLRNMTLGLVEHGRIKTTVTRAKALRPFVERIVTRLKDPSISNIRLVQRTLPHRDCVMTIAREIAPKFKDRNGGYLRIMRLASPRAGDAADMALIEWVEASLVKAYQEVVESKKSKAGGKKKKPAVKKSSESGDVESAKEKSAKPGKSSKSKA